MFGNMQLHNFKIVSFVHARVKMKVLAAFLIHYPRTMAAIEYLPLCERRESAVYVFQNGGNFDI